MKSFDIWMMRVLSVALVISLAGAFTLG